VPEDPDAPLPAVGPHLHAVFACSQRQVRDAMAQGFTERVARAPAMAIELVAPPDAPPDVERGVDLQEVGAINDLAYGNADHGVERTFARLPASAVHAYGRRDRDGRLVSVGLAFDRGDDATIQYVATKPAARRAGHATAIMRAALADAAARGLTTTTLTASDEGRPIYERLGYRVVGTVELWRRRE
jgi:ribosomal protein S18 acetylase RimI-like enzyme